MTASDIQFSPKRLYIGGEWVDSVQGKKFSTINPSNCKLLGEVPLADGEDVNRAVKAAKKHSKTGVECPSRNGLDSLSVLQTPSWKTEMN